MAEPTIQQLTEQVQKLTLRVAALERELGMRAPSPDPVITPKAPAQNLEQKLGLRFVNRVGAVTLILGVAFFFRYAVENNWIGETARVLLGMLGGCALLGAGEFWFRRGQQVFAQGVSGVGAAVLYLSCYAAFDSYRLISMPIALFALTGVTAFAAALAIRYRSQAFAILALCGGLLVPVLLHPDQFSPWFVPIYAALLDAAFLIVSDRYGWYRCKWLALAGTALLSIEMNGTPLLALLPVYYLLFSLRADRALLVGAHVVLLGRASFLDVYTPELVGMSAAGVAVLRWRKWNTLAPWFIVAAGLSWAIGGTHLPLQLALFTLGGLFLLFLTTADPLALPLNAAFFFGACYQRLQGWGDGWAALLAFAMACMYFGLAWRFDGLRRVVCGVTGHLLFLLAIALGVVNRLGYTNASSATISILFAVYAVALVAAGTALRTAENRYLGLGLIALVVVKLYLYDVWQLDTVYRIIAFAALGGLLLTMSFFYSRYRDRISSWLKSPAASEAHPPQPPE